MIIFLCKKNMIILFLLIKKHDKKFAKVVAFGYLRPTLSSTLKFWENHYEVI